MMLLVDAQMRLLVTGSRNWTNRDQVRTLLKYHYTLARNAGKNLIVVHGDCPTGADRMAREWVEEMHQLGFEGVDQEPHPAAWGRDCDEHCYHRPRTKNGRHYCPMAGHLRNQKMVDLGAYLCLAFPLPDSRGTKDCITRAKKANIPIDAITVAY